MFLRSAVHCQALASTTVLTRQGKLVEVCVNKKKMGTKFIVAGWMQKVPSPWRKHTRVAVILGVYRSSHVVIVCYDLCLLLCPRMNTCTKGCTHLNSRWMFNCSLQCLHIIVFGHIFFFRSHWNFMLSPFHLPRNTREGFALKDLLNRSLSVISCYNWSSCTNDYSVSKVKLLACFVLSRTENPCILEW